MPDLTIRYTVEKTVNIRVEDFELTQEEIEERIDREIEKFVPYEGQDVETEWFLGRAPLAKEESPIPPDDFWMQTPRGEIATNGWIALLKDFPIPNGFMPGRAWQRLSAESGAKLEQHFSADFTKMPLHTGWFRSEFLALKMDGIEVRGKDPSEMGYIIFNSELMGVVMPFQLDRKPDDAFQFHKTKSVKLEPALPLLELISEAK